MSFLFKSKFPILSAAMNKVSNADLAIACHNAGIFPSISAFNFIYDFGGEINYEHLKNECIKFKNSTNSGNLLLSISVEKLLVEKILSIYNEGLVTHLEIICENISLDSGEKIIPYFQSLENLIKPLKENGLILIMKCVGPLIIHEIHKNFKSDIFDGYIIKGPDGAGQIGNLNNNLEKDISFLLKKYPELKIIASGGIATSLDVKKYLDLGVDSVAIGTLLAMSLESNISIQTKNAVLERKNENLFKFSDSNQRAMVFSNIKDDDLNHTASLIKGIRDPSEGHIFLGNGIKNVNKIKSVKEIVEYLTTNI